MKMHWITGLLIALMAVSCSEAKFKGDGGAQPLQLSCHPSSNEIETGQDMLIIVNASSAFDGKITQSIQKPGGKKDDFNLKKNGSAYVVNDQIGNSFRFSEVGEYQVQLSADDESKTIASCSFTVKESPCKDALEVTGVNVAFILDNSHSTGSTDCPSREKIGTFANDPKGVNNYKCNGETNREKAVIQAVTALKEIGDSAQVQSELAHSQIGVGYFPTKDNYISGSRVTTTQWLRSEGNPKEINQYMTFAREPYGMTPYGSGLSAAEQMFDNTVLSDKRNELVVFITDGEPTDQNPQQSAEVAKRLQDKGINIATVFVNAGAERKNRVAEHLNLLKGSNGAWYDRFAYSNFDAYAIDLMGNTNELSLVEKMTSKVQPSCKDSSGSKCARQFVEVNDWNQLKTVLEGIVRKSVQCKK